MVACSAITAFAPSIFAKSIFAPRRADKSIEADNAPVSIMNGCVAAAQVAKIGEGIVGIAHDSSSTISSKIVNIDNALKGVSKNAGQLTRFGMEHINGLIGATSLIKAVSSDDKESALIQEGSAFVGMRACEELHKKVFGSSSSKCVNGENEIEVKEGLYKKVPILKKEAEKFEEYCNKHSEAMKDCEGVKKFVGKVLKYVPAGIKGVSFAMTSIAGFAGFHALGELAAEKITGRECA